MGCKDGHNDFPIWIRAFYQNHIYQQNFSDGQNLFGQVDFRRLREGKIRGQFWSVYVEWYVLREPTLYPSSALYINAQCLSPKEAGNYSTEVYHEIVHDTIQQIDLVYRLIKEFPDHLQHAFSAGDVRSDFASSGRISSLLGIEGLHQIGNSASILRMYHALGVRYATLSHTCHNAFADSEEPHRPLHNGLSQTGVAMVKEMNRLGMIVDLSHTSFATQRSALAVSEAPVIFSHSNAYALCNHTRNVPDDVLLALQENGGVIMVTFYPAFTAQNRTEASLDNVADHIQYIGELIGYDHVGIGSDFDGMDHGPKGLEDVSKYPDLVAELLRRGIPRKSVEGITGKNILRVFHEVEGIARRKTGLKPLEDDVKPFFGA